MYKLALVVCFVGTEIVLSCKIRELKKEFNSLSFLSFCHTYIKINVEFLEYSTKSSFSLNN